jgi:pseudouridine kinase
MSTSETNAPRIAVIGSVFLDLIYDRPLNDSGAEPVQKFNGGIGRNVAENLGWIGLRPRLVTLMTPDNLGERVAAELAGAGVDLAAKYVSPGIGVYRAFVRAGEIEQYEIKQPLIERMDWRFVREQLHLVSHLVVEMGLDRSMMHDLLVHCKRHGIPAYGVPTRVREIPIDQQLAIISRLDCVIMNRLEAEAILRRRVSTCEAAQQAVTELQRKGVRRAVITLGPDGTAAVDDGFPPALYTTAPADAVNTLGCGDAFTAAFVAALAVGYAFPSAIEAGLELARRTLEAPGPVLAGAGCGLLAYASQQSRMNAWHHGVSVRRHAR